MEEERMAEAMMLAEHLLALQEFEKAYLRLKETGEAKAAYYMSKGYSERSSRLGVVTPLEAIAELEKEHGAK